MFSERKFASLPYRKKHQLAGRHLQNLHEKGLQIDDDYRKMETHLTLAPLSSDFESLSDRFHLHMKEGAVSLMEHYYLVKQCDRLSTTPYLPITLYLEDLRSSFNVGSILRTVEAFRLGSVVFSEETPASDHPKVIKTSMGTAKSVPSRVGELSSLPRPWIALETAPTAPSLFTFSFPPTFSLLLGNEARGLKRSTIQQADCLLQIPLCGSKNSLNVASALAIAGAFIKNQLRSD
ncbi:MAG: TrmH family RNA methyltransferase [Chlamydiia bacterium]|nr:TrmH family RNA methyltransferase [Chlamydiia bacterium]